MEPTSQLTALRLVGLNCQERKKAICLVDEARREGRILEDITDSSHVRGRWGGSSLKQCQTSGGMAGHGMGSSNLSQHLSRADSALKRADVESEDVMWRTWEERRQAGATSGGSDAMRCNGTRRDKGKATEASVGQCEECTGDQRNG